MIRRSLFEIARNMPRLTPEEIRDTGAKFSVHSDNEIQDDSVTLQGFRRGAIEGANYRILGVIGMATGLSSLPDTGNPRIDDARRSRIFSLEGRTIGSIQRLVRNLELHFDD